MAGKRKSRKKKKIIKWIIIGVIAVAIIGGIIAGSMTGGIVAEVVSTAAVSRGELTATVVTSGTVQSVTSRSYYADTSLKIAEINVKAGDVVQAGDQLITFDEEDIMQAISQTTLSFDMDNSTYLARIQTNQQNRADYNQAVADVANYQALIDTQKEYIKGLEDGISSERQERQEKIAYEVENLNIQNLSYQREISKLQGQAGNMDPNEYRDQVNYYEKLIMSNNMRLQQLSTESSLLQNFETEDNKEDLLVIAKEDLTELQTQLTRAESTRDTAERAIMNSNEISSLDAGNELLDLQTAAKLEHLEAALAGVTSDFNGVVTKVSVTEGARVGEGTLLITVESTEDMVMRFSASKYDLASLALGQEALITVTGREYHGTLTHIDHMATQNSSGTSVVNAEVSITDPDENIYLGIDGKIRITTAVEDAALIVPVEAVNADREGNFCYIVEDGVARKRYVTTGISSNTEIQILEGLSEGAEVITTVSGTLEEGTPVIVATDINGEGVPNNILGGTVVVE